MSRMEAGSRRGVWIGPVLTSFITVHKTFLISTDLLKPCVPLQCGSSVRCDMVESERPAVPATQSSP